MQLQARREPLTGVDHAWLRMESRVNPMVITALIVLDGPVDPGHLEAVLADRLVCHPRFRQRIAPGAPWSTPRWEEDSRFNLRHHVIREKLPPPGGRAWLETRVGELFGKPMDHRRPLWDVRVFENYEGGTALVCRFHHAIADGMALLHILLSLTDAKEEAPPRRQRQGRAKESFRPADLLDPDRVIELAKRGANGAMAIGRLLTLPPDRTPIRGRLTTRKSAAWTEAVEIDRLKKLGKLCHGTVNDVLQSAIAGSIGRYLEGRGVATDGLEVRAVIPVDLRPPGRPPDTGNHFGLVFLDLPVGIRDPLERLIETKRRMDVLKASPEAPMVFSLLHAIGYAAPRIEEAALKLFGSKASVVMSNVPGPKEPRLLAGREIKDILFWVPESGGIGLGVSFFGYGGRLRVGVVGDAGIVPDPAAITTGFEAELARLEA